MPCADTTPPSTEPRPLTYALRLVETQAATGFFMPVPEAEPAFAIVLNHLRDHPFDEFMHRYGLEQLGQMALPDVRQQLASAGDDCVLTALLLEAITIHAHLAPLKDQLNDEQIAALRHDTPLLVLRSETLRDQKGHRQWSAHLKAHLQQHQAPVAPAVSGLAPLFPDPRPRRWITLDEVAVPSSTSRAPGTPPSFEAVYDSAMQGLNGLDILAETEMRHESSLSPIALLRRWNMDVRIQQDRHHYRFHGLQTSYGKGLSLERARASCAMEIVERCSSFTSVVDGRLPDAAQPFELERAKLSDWRQRDQDALDPGTLNLEVPYEDQPLYWIQGTRMDGSAIMVPFQTVFLFANLDEIGLFSGLGSTGLAGGSTMAQARFHALLECIERDAEAVQPFDTGRCFRLTTRDPAVGSLLADYRRRGIDVFFQDCTTDLGIPCYKCFVYGPGPDDIAKGTSAHFTGWQAALAALTETPYPYPQGPGSRPGPPGLPVRYLEELPDHASGNLAADLARLEQLLAANHFYPVYVDLTRRDLEIPVVRALVPGLELMADFDHYARVSPRLYANYCRLAEQRGSD